MLHAQKPETNLTDPPKPRQQHSPMDFCGHGQNKIPISWAKLPKTRKNR